LVVYKIHYFVLIGVGADYAALPALAQEKDFAGNAFSGRLAPDTQSLVDE
jgi:hypothetical protein